MKNSMIRTRWAAIGAAAAVVLGAGGIGIASATVSSGERSIYEAIEPCRLSDTRAGSAVGPRTSPLGPGEVYPLAGRGEVGRCDLPGDSSALSLNVTGLDATEATFFTLYPGSEAPPEASHLNLVPDQPPTPNAVNVDLDADGEFSVFNAFGSAHLIIDVVGVYRAHDHDDRYYRKAQIDQRRAAVDQDLAELDQRVTAVDQAATAVEQRLDASETMWVRIAPDGTVISSSSGVITGEEYALPTGRVVARFGRDVATCAYGVVAVQDSLGTFSHIAVSGEDIGVPIGPDAVFVYTERDGSPFDIDIAVTVNC